MKCSAKQTCGLPILLALCVPDPGGPAHSHVIFGSIPPESCLSDPSISPWIEKYGSATTLRHRPPLPFLFCVLPNPSRDRRCGGWPASRARGWRASRGRSSRGGGQTWRGVGGEVRGNEGVPLGDLFRWSGRWLEEEEAGAPAIREAEESSGWPHSEANERLSRSSAGNKKIGGSSRKLGVDGSPRSAIAPCVTRSAASSLPHSIEARCHDRGSPRKPGSGHPGGDVTAKATRTASQVSSTTVGTFFLHVQLHILSLHVLSCYSMTNRARFWLTSEAILPRGTGKRGYHGYREIPRIFRTNFIVEF